MGDSLVLENEFTGLSNSTFTRLSISYHRYDIEHTLILSFTQVPTVVTHMK